MRSYSRCPSSHLFPNTYVRHETSVGEMTRSSRVLGLAQFRFVEWKQHGVVDPLLGCGQVQTSNATQGHMSVLPCSPPFEMSLTVTVDVRSSALGGRYEDV